MQLLLTCWRGYISGRILFLFSQWHSENEILRHRSLRSKRSDIISYLIILWTLKFDLILRLIFIFCQIGDRHECTGTTVSSSTCWRLKLWGFSLDFCPSFVLKHYPHQVGAFSVEFECPKCSQLPFPYFQGQTKIHTLFWFVLTMASRVDDFKTFTSWALLVPSFRFRLMSRFLKTRMNPSRSCILDSCQRPLVSIWIPSPLRCLKSPSVRYFLWNAAISVWLVRRHCRTEKTHLWWRLTVLILISSFLVFFSFFIIPF